MFTRAVQLILILIVFFGANVYVFYRLFMMTPTILPLQILLILAAVILQLPFFVSLLLGNSLPTKLVSVLYQIGTSWIIIFLYLFIIFALLDIISFTHLVNIRPLITHSWLAWGVLISFVSILLIVGNIVYYNKKRVEIDIKIDKPLARPLRIVAISDLHLGYGIKKDELEGWIGLINAENPDIVLIAGDVVDNFAKPLFEDKVYKTLRRIKARYGVYMALGNHEYIGGEIDRNLNFLSQANIQVLRDSATLIDNTFYIIGRDDASRKYRNSLANITDRLDHTKPMIVLDHQPSGFEEAQKCGIDLLLSGHTHGGQVFPISLVVKAVFKHSYGYHTANGTHFYITSGLGIWGGKFRIGSRSEYVVINLQGR